MMTLVGYAGGSSVNPTYRNLDGHSETIQMQFDPAVISYERLLEIFWADIDPTRQPGGRQYAAIIFYHGDEQKRQVEESRQRLEERLKKKVVVELVPYTRFYPAEDYHQKYYLQQSRELMQALRSIYPNIGDLIRSTATARLNAFQAGYLSLSRLQAELSKLKLPQTAFEAVLNATRGAGVLSAH